MPYLKRKGLGVPSKLRAVHRVGVQDIHATTSPCARCPKRRIEDILKMFPCGGHHGSELSESETRYE